MSSITFSIQNFHNFDFQKATDLIQFHGLFPQFTFHIKNWGTLPKQNKTFMPSVNVPFAQKICLDDQVLPSGTSRHDMCMWNDVNDT